MEAQLRRQQETSFVAVKLPSLGSWFAVKWTATLTLTPLLLKRRLISLGAPLIKNTVDGSAGPCILLEGFRGCLPKGE